MKIRKQTNQRAAAVSADKEHFDPKTSVSVCLCLGLKEMMHGEQREENDVTERPRTIQLQQQLQNEVHKKSTHKMKSAKQNQRNKLHKNGVHETRSEKRGVQNEVCKTTSKNRSAQQSLQNEGE